MTGFTLGTNELSRICCWTVLVVFVAGCVGGGLPPVSDRSRATNAAKAPGEYVVVAGDTLYSIAWRHQRDFRSLASLNGIKKPYDIYPGQRLRVRANPDGVKRSAGLPRAPGPRPAPAPKVTVVAKSQTTPAKPHPLSRTQTKPQNSSHTQPQRPPQKPPQKPPQRAAQAQPKPGAKPAVVSVSGTGPVKLRWPSSGERIRSFGEQPPGAQKPSNSIDFLLRPGAAIRAAAAGEVVYVGRGLAGFEQFVIVKHNDTWLSAYGFNALAAVREKQLLAQGAVLATLGSGRLAGADAARARQLHFELRKNGTPVNPAQVIN